MKSSIIFFLMNVFPFLLIASSISAKGADACSPDYDVSRIKDVIVDEKAKYITNEIEIIVDRPCDEVYTFVVYTPLEKQLHGTEKIPGVHSTKTLNNIKFGEAGYRRLVCLDDGNTAVEEFIENSRGKYFSYKVWDYTLKAAKVIDYAKGEFWFIPLENTTRIRWRYSFKLDDRTILGKLGFIGRWIFKIAFIKTRYNDFMVKTLNDTKKAIEESDI